MIALHVNTLTKAAAKSLFVLFIFQFNFLLQSTIANATSVAFDFSGTITKVNFSGPDGYISPVAIGDQFNGKFAYSFTSQPVDQIPGNSNLGIYDPGHSPELSINYSVNFNNFTIDSGVNFIFVRAGDTLPDLFKIGDLKPVSTPLFPGSTPGSPGDHFFIDELYLTLTSTLGAFINDNCPTTLNQQFFDTFTLDFFGDNGSRDEPRLSLSVSGNLSLTPSTPSPEPSTLLMFMAGFLGIAATGRSKKNQFIPQYRKWIISVSRSLP